VTIRLLPAMDVSTDVTILSANPAVRKREETLLALARTDAIDAKPDKLVEVAASTPPRDPPSPAPWVILSTTSQGRSGEPDAG
jgi:hypothetical protein